MSLPVAMFGLLILEGIAWKTAQWLIVARLHPAGERRKIFFDSYGSIRKGQALRRSYRELAPERGWSMWVYWIDATGFGVYMLLLLAWIIALNPPTRF